MLCLKSIIFGKLRLQRFADFSTIIVDVFSISREWDDKKKNLKRHNGNSLQSLSIEKKMIKTHVKFIQKEHLRWRDFILVAVVYNVSDTVSIPSPTSLLVLTYALCVAGPGMPSLF